MELSKFKWDENNFGKEDVLGPCFFCLGALAKDARDGKPTDGAKVAELEAAVWRAHRMVLQLKGVEL